jgi:hypothetical protein
MQQRIEEGDKGGIKTVFKGPSAPQRLLGGDFGKFLHFSRGDAVQRKRATVLVLESVRVRTRPAETAEGAQESGDGSLDRAPRKVGAVNGVVGRVPSPLQHHRRNRLVPHDGRVVKDDLSIDRGTWV